MTNIFDYRLQIGNAIWLLVLLSSNVEQGASSEWMHVTAAGEIQPFSDEALAVAMKVSAPTATRWRKRLEKAELIRSTLVGTRTRVFEVKKIGRMAEMPERTEAVGPMVN